MGAAGGINKGNYRFAGRQKNRWVQCKGKTPLFKVGPYFEENWGAKGKMFGTGVVRNVYKEQGGEKMGHESNGPGKRHLLGRGSGVHRRNRG